MFQFGFEIQIKSLNTIGLCQIRYIDTNWIEAFEIGEVSTPRRSQGSLRGPHTGLTLFFENRLSVNCISLQVQVLNFIGNVGV